MGSRAVELLKRFADKASEDENIPNMLIDDPAVNSLAVGINVWGNALSIIGGSLVVLITLGLWLYDRRLVDRISLRLNVAISLVDIAKAAAILYYTFYTVEGFWCSFNVFFIVLTTNLYLFLTTSIAFNLQWVVLMEKPYRPWMEKWLYFFGSIFISLVFSVPPFIAGRYGLDRAQGFCWYQDSWTMPAKIWEWYSWVIPTSINIIYCMVVTGLVAAKIYRSNALLNKQISTDVGTATPRHISSIQRRTQLAVNRVLIRILLYPLIPFLTQTVFIISEVYIHVHNKNLWGLVLAGNLTTDIPGLCNFIAFLVDPALYNALDKIKADLVDRHGDPSKKGLKSALVRTFLGTRNKHRDVSGLESNTISMSALGTSHGERWQKIEDPDEEYMAGMKTDKDTAHMITPPQNAYLSNAEEGVRYPSPKPHSARSRARQAKQNEEDLAQEFIVKL
ncbi:uncharacterized protein VTP21DRAFT_11621 [Calcarisporiella thermophila]|uniref:uncharacterized protein n=1 Tax=Calcarisporiella thermophila TaxID=911321 RepID=UPI0037422A7D